MRSSLRVWYRPWGWYGTRNDVLRHVESRHDFTISRRDTLEVCLDFHPQGNKRAQGKPDARCTRGLVCKRHKEKTHTSIQVQRRHPAFPAQWFTAYFALSPVSRALLPPSLRRSSPQSLAPASGARTTRLRRPLESRSSVATFASTASHRTFVTTRDPPLSSGETGEAIVMICPTG